MRGLWGTDEGYFDDDFDASPPPRRVPYPANTTNTSTVVVPSTAVIVNGGGVGDACKGCSVRRASPGFLSHPLAATATRNVSGTIAECRAFIAEQRCVCSAPPPPHVMTPGGNVDRLELDFQRQKMTDLRVATVGTFLLMARFASLCPAHFSELKKLVTTNRAQVTRLRRSVCRASRGFRMLRASDAGRERRECAGSDGGYIKTGGRQRSAPWQTCTHAALLRACDRAAEV